MKTLDDHLLRLGAAGALALSLAGTAFGQSADGTAGFENPYGYSYGGWERPYEARGLRDENGNLLIVNGIIQSSSSLGYGLNSEWGQTEGFAGSGNGQAIGNQLNVITQGNYNTVIIDSTQINNGNQTTILNGGLDLDD